MYSHTMSTGTGALRIGEFSRRVGVSPELLRAWERRYGLLRPVRTEGGFRLYTDDDAERVERMKRALVEGFSAAEAASRALALADAGSTGDALDGAQERLVAAAHAYDEATVHAVLDEALARFSLETVLRDLVLPVLREIGEEWQQGALEVAQEHFASNLLRERLLALARLWGRGGGRLAILACAPGERHDIGLIAFGLVLRSHGWRILFLGADTPIATLRRAVETTDAHLVVVASMDAALLDAQGAELRRLGRSAPLVLSGAGASEDLCRRLRVDRLDGDLVTAAGDVSRSPPAVRAR
jgi:DNA-binding transcriptional MerR regulator